MNKITKEKERKNYSDVQSEYTYK